MSQELVRVTGLMEDLFLKMVESGVDLHTGSKDQ